MSNGFIILNHRFMVPDRRFMVLNHRFIVDYRLRVFTAILVNADCLAVFPSQQRVGYAGALQLLIICTAILRDPGDLRS